MFRVVYVDCAGCASPFLRSTGPATDTGHDGRFPAQERPQVHVYLRPRCGIRPGGDGDVDRWCFCSFSLMCDVGVGQKQSMLASLLLFYVDDGHWPCLRITEPVL